MRFHLYYGVGALSVLLAGCGGGVSAPISINLSPATVSLSAGQAQQFTATVQGASGQVIWTATGGTIDSSGNYTAGSNAGMFTVTATSQADAQKSASASVTISHSQPSSHSSQIFTSPSAAWLYSAPTGSGIDISSVTSSFSFHINTHDGGWDYPVQYTDATHGYTTFTDSAYYGRTDRYAVPNPANGYRPSTGSSTDTDGHLVVVDTTHRVYYDFWKLVTVNGVPTTTDIGQITSASLDSSDGRPGSTAAQITGLAGTILPGELDCETCLNHALSVVVEDRMNSPRICKQGPVFSTDGHVNGGVFCEGAKIQFDPAIDVGSMPASTPIKAIMRALQLYGGLITDQSGGLGMSFYSSLPSQPDTTGINLIGQHLRIYY